jgi:hypothetical protein
MVYWTLPVFDTIEALNLDLKNIEQKFSFLAMAFGYSP